LHVTAHILAVHHDQARRETKERKIVFILKTTGPREKDEKQTDVKDKKNHLKQGDQMRL
jgi:hypothetical protein